MREMDIPFYVDPERALRLCGYGDIRPAPKRIRDLAWDLADTCRELAVPRAVWEMYEVGEIDDGRVVLGSVEFTGTMPIRVLTGADMAAVCVMTIGPGVDREVSRRFADGDSLGGMLLDVLGTAALASVGIHLRNRLEKEEATSRGLSMTAPFGPGQCHWDLRDQRALFSLVDAESIGVSLDDSCLMNPKKSVSAIVGIGDEKNILTLTSCDLCDRPRCTGRDMRLIFES
ncbi:MAG: hypothetical protein JW885_03655 [Deltaproteobacteria bacterium]|nr:hypothetical protein [Candidatus Zymogenaceae bacterium]